MSQLGLSMSEGGAGSPDEPRPPRRAHTLRSALAVLVALALVVTLAGAAYLGVRAVGGLIATEPEDYPGPGGEAVQVEVEPGQSARAIGRTLAEADVVASERAFTDAAAAEPLAAGIQPGFYNLRAQMAASAALAILVDPANIDRSRVTVPEGLRQERVLDLLSERTAIPREDFVAALADPATLGLPDYAQGNPEGFLFPATYDLAPDATAGDILRQMIARFTQAAADVGLTDGPRSAYELVVIASLLEGEGRPEHFLRISRVVYNRLAIDRELQFDSTVSYALGGNLTRVSNEDLQVDSAFNTYANKGLPPAPINSPGEAALRAAKAPAEGDWIYFVTVDLDTGETKFTADEAEFTQFVAELRQFQADNPE